MHARAVGGQGGERQLRSRCGVADEAGVERDLGCVALARERADAREVARTLRRRVTQGTYRPGSRIPTAGELVREFGVSGHHGVAGDPRSHDRRAAARAPGARHVRHRSAAHRPTFGAELRASMADDMRRAGIDPGFEERSLTLVECDDEIATRLGLRGGTRVYRQGNLLLADREPVGLEENLVVVSSTRTVEMRYPSGQGGD
jgi:Bacterial regulatory proteins, gntR family